MLNIADIKDAADNDETPDGTDEDCIYKLDAKLLSGDNLLSERDKDGKVLIPAKYDYDESGIYVPYTAEYQAIGCKVIDGIWYEDDDHKHKFHTEDNVYLKIHRVEDTKAAILIKCTWTRKAGNEYLTFNSFNIECTWGEILDKYAKFKADGTVKSNKLNQKASATGRDIGLPASEGSYVSFIEDMRRDILLSPCLEVLKVKNYEWPEIPDTDEDDNEDIPSCFNDYPEDIQDGALYLINNNLLLDNIMNTSVSSRQYGNEEVKRSLILTTTTPYVLEPLHTLLDGKRGGGKTALIMEIVKNYPDAHIFQYQTFSAKNIFYDKDKFNPDGVNILILDDPNLNSDDKVETLKILSDNEKRVKTLHTVINQKAVEFELTGKFLIIITYAKEIPDEELANRLHNTSLIVAESEKNPIKRKIRNNTVNDIKNNAAVMRIREYNKAAIHYLSERHMKIYNPFNLFINVDDFNNRDITDLMSIILANGFFNYSNLKSISVNDVELVIGSYDEVAANLTSWNEDEYQSEKLSSRQKEIMDMLPAYTDEEAEEKVSEVIDKIPADANINFKMREIEKELYTINRIAKAMELSTSTVNNALNRNHKEGSNVRSLAEMDLVHKIQIDSSDIQTHPNIFYKPIKETEGASSDDDENIYAAMQTEFTKLINTSNGKQSILINLLIYVNITLNKTGYMYLKKYCSSYDKMMAADDYDSYYDFIHDFMDGLNDDHCIDVDTASIDELRVASEEMEKILGYVPDEVYDESTKLSNISEDALNENHDADELCKTESHTIHGSSFKNEGTISEMGYDFSIIQKVSDILRFRYATAEDVLSRYDEFDIGPDGTNDEKVIIIANGLKKMAADGLINKTMMNGKTVYEMTDKQYDFINAKVSDGSDTG